MRFLSVKCNANAFYTARILTDDTFYKTFFFHLKISYFRTVRVLLKKVQIPVIENL